MVAFKDIPIASLTLINERSPSSSSTPSTETHPASRITAAGRSCKYCPGAVFDDQEEFRAHYQSPWHVHNQNLSLRSRPPVSWEVFEAIQSIEDSSESSDDFWEEGSGDEDELHGSDDEQAEHVDPLVSFHCNNRSFSLYRSLLFPSRQEYRESIVTADLLRSFIQAASHSTWALFLIKSGRVFAGIYDHSTCKFTQKRTFKRYTERRKQGGSQMLRDKAGRVAKSAGSQLRRQNEQALLREVEEVVREWEGELERCQVILWNRTFFGQAALFPATGGGLARFRQSTLRTFPFSTYKPSEEEALRCMSRFCFQVKV